MATTLSHRSARTATQSARVAPRSTRNTTQTARGATRPGARHTATVLFAAAALALVGCGSGGGSPEGGGSAPDDTTSTSAATDPPPDAADGPDSDGPTDDGPTDDEIAAAEAHGVAVLGDDATSVAVHATPHPSAPARELPAATSLGAPLHLRVLEATSDGDWLRVQVPQRDGGHGWVEAADVTVTAVRHHITVDLSDRELVLREGGEPVLTTTIAVGTDENPTPTGRFLLTDKLASDPGGAYGPYVFGVSVWSPTLSEFAGGDGQIGLHGTDRPDLLGQAVSHGCVRVSNEVVTELAGVLPLGVPVDIRA